MAIAKYKLKNGEERWLVRLYLGVNPDTGEEIRIKKEGFKSYRAANNAEKRILGDFDIHNHIEKKNSQKYKFSEVTELWLLQYKNTVKENTYISAEKLIKRKIIPLFGKYYIDRISIKICQKAINEWYETYTRSSLLVSYFNRIMDFSISIGYCHDNPMKRTVRPKNTHKKDYQAPFYTKEELAKLFEKTLESEDFVYYVMFRVLAFTGLRRGELLGLKWTDIDFNKELLSVSRVLAKGIDGVILQSPKTKSSKRVISIDQQTMKILHQWKIEQQKRFFKHGTKFDKTNYHIFTNELNKPFALERPGKVLQRIVDKYDLAYIHIHGFRHTHCSLLFEAGVSMEEVKDRLGHSDITTTMNIYTHVTQVQRDQVANKFADFMSM